MEFALTVFPEPTAFIKPSKSALNDPPLGKNSKPMQFIAFDNLHIGANRFFNGGSERLANIPAVTKDICNMTEGRLIIFDHLTSPGFVRNIGCCHINCMRQPIGIYCNMPFNPRYLFAGIIPLFPRCVSVLNTLGIDDTKTRPCALSIVYTP